MKSVGIIRRVDTLGRLVIPKELRITLGIGIGDALEIYTENEMIIFKKYSPECIFCDEANDIVSYKGMNYCRKCYDKLRK